MRTPISLADALLAASHLAPRDDEAREAIEEMLGLARVPPRTAAPTLTLGVWKGSANETVGRTTEPPRVPVSAEAASSVVSPPDAGAEPPRPPAAAAADTVRVSHNPAERRAPRRPQWLEAKETAANPPIATTPDAVPPLFSALSDRAIVAAALGTSVDEGDVDLDRLVDDMATGQPLESVPREAVLTVRRGAQVLVDAGPGMYPYRLDLDRLIERITAILPSDLVAIESFLGCPTRVGHDPGEDGSTWTPPPPGTPVIVVTDLGIGGPGRDRATPSEWLAFARTVRAAGHPLIGFIPYEVRRWPPQIARAMTLLHWSERTGIGAVRRAIREATRRRS